MPITDLLLTPAPRRSSARSPARSKAVAGQSTEHSVCAAWQLSASSVLHLQLQSHLATQSVSTLTYPEPITCLSPNPHLTLVLLYPGPGLVYAAPNRARSLQLLVLAQITFRHRLYPRGYCCQQMLSRQLLSVSRLCAICSVQSITCSLTQHHSRRHFLHTAWS